jgi:hypothetical protein
LLKKKERDMRFRSTITIPREHRKALFQDLRQASGYTAATEDWEVLSDWYRWSSNDGKDGALVFIQPGSSGSCHLLSLVEKARPHEWLEVCKILAPYTPEGSALEWDDGDTEFSRFFFTGKTVVFQVGEIIYRDQPLPESPILEQ